MSGRQDKFPRWKVLREINPCFCPNPRCGKAHLSEKQMDVWQLTAEGHQPKAAALILKRGVKGVEWNKAKLQRALNTWGDARLTMSAIRNGIIEP